LSDPFSMSSAGAPGAKNVTLAARFAFEKQRLDVRMWDRGEGTRCGWDWIV
jgi:hypothetical protein